MQEQFNFDDPDSDISIAILDGPVDTAHVCFARARLETIYVKPGDRVSDNPALAHGTHVASIIFGHPDVGFSGLATACGGMILPVFTTASDGNLAARALDVIAALDIAVQRGVHVICISGGRIAGVSGHESAFLAALKTCETANILIVVSLSDVGFENRHLFTGLKAGSVLLTEAIGPDDGPIEPADWSHLSECDGLLASGCDSLGASPGGGAVLRTGTGFAVATIAGHAAALMCAQETSGEQSDPLHIGKILYQTGTKATARQNPRKKLPGKQIDFEAAQKMLDKTGKTSLLRLAFTNEKGPAVEADPYGVCVKGVITRTN